MREPVEEFGSARPSSAMPARAHPMSIGIGKVYGERVALTKRSLSNRRGASIGLLGVVAVLGAVALGWVAVGIAGGRLGDSGESGAAEPIQQASPRASLSTHGVRFEQLTVDPDPPSGDGCCLDTLATGDVDGDGRSDLIVGAESADGLSWYRAPSGSVNTPGWQRFVIGAGDFTTDLEAMDLDADGDLDILASAIDRNVIEWWEQVGDPTVAGGWVRHEVGADFAHDLAVADVDGDGDLDAVAFHKDAQRLDWFEQGADPAGSWTAHVVDELPGEGLTASDLDMDGDVDLVAGPAVYTNEDGDGVSWSRRSLAEDWEAEARSAVADIDLDGTQDIVLSTPESDGRLSWFRGPNWEETVIDPDAGYTHSLEVGDVDLDGWPDVFAGVMHFAGTHEVRVLFGDGGSSWTPEVLTRSGTHNARLVDLDDDDRLDVVGKNFDGPKQVEIWWNRVAGSAVTTEIGPDAGGAMPLDGFSYVRVDDGRAGFSESMPYFGIAFGDVDGDGRDDIVSGGYAYSNPGGDLSSSWIRVDFADSIGTVVDAMLVTDVDRDTNADVIATALPDVWWLEAGDRPGEWTGTVVAQVPATSRPNGQGYRLGDLTGDGRDEIVLSGGASESEVWYVQIPDDPANEWSSVRITDRATDEQIGIGDVNGDGLLDVSAGDMYDGGSFVAWFENPGDGSADWTRHRVGAFPGVFPDRMQLVDLDGDERLDILVSEENDGSQPNAEVMWFQQPEDPYSSEWERHVIVTQYTTNGLDAADLDGDGDVDLTTGEHRGSKRVSIWENAGTGQDGQVGWIEHPVDEGKESHLGARVWDLDGDGDMEIVSIGFDQPQDLHLWVND